MSINISVGEWAVFKGHTHSENDLVVRCCILEIACKGELHSTLLQQVMTKTISNELKEMQEEGIIELSPCGMKVTETGRAFVRNICSVFDQTIRREPGKQIFSRAI